MTPADLLTRELQRDGARPLLTWYDDATGERAELSVATTVNWANKVANLLVDEFGADVGDDVGVLLPAHWETAVVLLGSWLAGAAVSVGTPGWVTFRTAHTVGGDPGRTVEMSLGPFGADFARVVAAQPDQFAAAAPVDEGASALSVGARTWTHGDLAAAATHSAAHHELDATCRVLSTLGYDSVDGLDAGLLVPLAAGGSVVLIGNADPGRQAERCAAERVTHTAGVDVPGLPRLDA